MGYEPHVIITDQDASVKAAVELVFTAAVHRLCMWHIMMKVVNKVKFPPRTCPSFIDSFHTKFKSIVWSDELSPDEFENQWFSILEEFGLQGHEWLCVMFDLRRYWIPSYFQDVRMSSLLRTTSRSESQNSFFGNFLSPQASLVVFMMQYNSAIESQRHGQKKLDMESSTRTPRMKTPLQIEKNCAAIYTINAFYEVQDEFMSGAYHCTLHELKKEADIHYYQVQDEFGRIGKVQHLVPGNDFQCSCNKFQKIGLPCCHIFMALKNCQAIDLPPSLINTRWTKQSILLPIFEVDGAVYDGSVFIDEKKRLLAEVMTEMYSCVDVVREDVEKLKELLCLLKEQKAAFNSSKIVDPSASTSSKKFEFEKFVGALPDEVSVHPPQLSNNKFKKRRLRSGQEVGIENSKKKKRMCRICKKPGHNAQTCPQFVD